LYNTPSCEVYSLLAEPVFIAVRFSHHAKAYSLMKITLSGMVTSVRLLQREKASPPMVVTLSGMVTLVMAV
jgi:hypothetical protein